MEYQVDIVSAQKITTPKVLILAHQTAARRGVPSKTKNTAIFDIQSLSKCFVDNDGVRFSREAVSIGYAGNDYLDQ